MRSTSVLLALLCSAAASHALGKCEFTRNIDYDIPAGDYTRVSIDARAGDLHVVGTGANKVMFKGKACTDKQEFLDRMSVNVDKENGVLAFTVVIPYHDDDFTAEYASIDITLALPSDKPIDIKDTSGDLTVRDAAVTSIDDTSGDLTVEHGHASLSVRDSSGDIEISDMDHDLTLVDSSGSIDVRGVGGDVSIPRDSSGDIRLRDVKGGVDIDSDSAGDIIIRHVDGPVRIGSDGSGDIEIGDVASDVSIGSDGSGYVRIDHVRGDFTLQDKGSGDIRVAEVSGHVTTPR